MVSETHHNANSQDSKIDGFILYEPDRKNGRGGGAAIYVKNSINHFPITLLDLVTLEATGISLKLKESKMTLVLCYLAFNKTLQKSDLSALRDCSQIIIAAGDLKAKHTNWGCRAANRNSIIISRLLNLTDDTAVLPPKKTTHFRRAELQIFSNAHSLKTFATKIHQLDQDKSKPVLRRFEERP